MAASTSCCACQSLSFCNFLTSRSALIDPQAKASFLPAFNQLHAVIGVFHSKPAFWQHSSHPFVSQSKFACKSQASQLSDLAAWNARNILEAEPELESGSAGRPVVDASVATSQERK